MSFEENVLIGEELSETFTVLISDDNPMLVSTLVRAARRAGITAITDTTATNVLHLARLHRPQLIVLDVNQAIDGRDLLADLKRDPVTRGIRVVMVTGAEDRDARDDCFQLGAEDFFTKPLDPYFFRRTRTR